MGSDQPFGMIVMKSTSGKVAAGLIPGRFAPRVPCGPTVMMSSTMGTVVVWLKIGSVSRRRSSGLAP